MACNPLADRATTAFENPARSRVAFVWKQRTMAGTRACTETTRECTDKSRSGKQSGLDHDETIPFDLKPGLRAGAC